MKTFKSIQDRFSLILKKRKNKVLSLELGKKQYHTLMEELVDGVQKQNRVLDLEDYKITSQTTFQEFEDKLENIIEFIQIQFLSEMGSIQ